jgi:hypothetical protein
MRYCTSCGSEYRDDIEQCSDCPGSPRLVEASEMSRRGLPLPHELDQRVFARAGTTDNPLMVEVFTGMLEERDIPVLVRAGRSGVVDKLTTGNLLPWWEILVPEEMRERAALLIERERAQEAATNDEAARAAEEEERESERSSPPPPAF